MSREQETDDDHSRRLEQLHMKERPQVEGVTCGTIIEYDDWQWGVVTEIAEEKDPSMVGFVLVDELGDHLVRVLESAWGCWEHYEAVKPYRWSEHEYWTPVEYVVEDEIWSVLGPLHPDERTDGEEVTDAA